MCGNLPHVETLSSPGNYSLNWAQQFQLALTETTTGVPCSKIPTLQLTLGHVTRFYIGFLDFIGFLQGFL